MRKKEEAGEDEYKVYWHDAFVEALQVELEEYKDKGALEFHPEYQLTQESLSIDCVIIKKAKGVVIDKNIARIFRESNILEYKSPTDYVSVFDFYKVYGYACFFIALEEVPVDEVTISFVESRYPRDLFKHLTNARGWRVEETSPGVYNVIGDMLPIQVIDSRRLPAEENLWLRSLSNKLSPTELEAVLQEAASKGKNARLKAFIQKVGQANPEALREVLKMSKATMTFEEILRDVGLADKFIAEGEATGMVKGMAQGM
jgi:hypothetical protein